MKTTRILSVLLALTVLTGSVPYGYAYCMMMKRAIDSATQLRCNPYREISQSSGARTPSLESATSMKRFVSKSTTDSYEHRTDRVNILAFTILMPVDSPSNPSIGSSLSVRFEVEHPPPDIIIAILSLKI